MLVNQYNSDKKVVFDKRALGFNRMATIIRWYVYADNESRFKEHYTFSSLNHWGWIWFFWLIIPASVVHLDYGFIA